MRIKLVIKAIRVITLSSMLVTVIAGQSLQAIQISDAILGVNDDLETLSFGSKQVCANPETAIRLKSQLSGEKTWEAHFASGDEEQLRPHDRYSWVKVGALDVVNTNDFYSSQSKNGPALLRSKDGYLYIAFPAGYSKVLLKVRNRKGQEAELEFINSSGHDGDCEWAVDANISHQDMYYELDEGEKKHQGPFYYYSNLPQQDQHDDEDEAAFGGRRHRQAQAIIQQDQSRKYCSVVERYPYLYPRKTGYSGGFNSACH